MKAARPQHLVRLRATDHDVQGRPQRGSVVLTVPIFMIGLLAMAGLVVDGGAALAARGRAHDVAAQAARAGADALSPASLRESRPEELVIDPVAAHVAAERYLAYGHATGTVTVAGQIVTVTAHVPRRAVLLSAFGLGDISGTATASATIINGTTGGA